MDLKGGDGHLADRGVGQGGCLLIENGAPLVAGHRHGGVDALQAVPLHLMVMKKGEEDGQVRWESRAVEQRAA